MPELLKQFIISYPTELLISLLILGGIGFGAVVGRVRRVLKASRADQIEMRTANQNFDSEMLLKLTDSLDALNQRVEQLEVVNDFERQLSNRSQSAGQ